MKIGYLILCALLSINVFSQNEICDFIDKLEKYQNQVELKIYSDNVYIDSTSFNLDYYFTLFDQVTKNEHYNFNYEYYYGLLDGHPRIYAIHDSVNIENLINNLMHKSLRYCDSIAFRYNDTISEYKFIPEEKDIHKRLMLRHNINFRSTLRVMVIRDSLTRSHLYITPKQSKIGYFQYLVYAIKGENFGLYWHSNYGKFNIVCSKDRLIDLINSGKSSGEYLFNEKDLSELLNLNLSPTVDFVKNDCLISLYSISFRGIYRSKYKVNTEYPYRIHLIENSLLIENNSNNRF